MNGRSTAYACFVTVKIGMEFNRGETHLRMVSLGPRARFLRERTLHIFSRSRIR